MWFKKKPERKPSFPVGGYVLNMMLQDTSGLREFSQTEYEVMRRQFVGEKIWHAAEVDFIHRARPWNLWLGTVEDRLYKIAPFFETWEKNEANEAASDALTFCNQHLGEPAEQRTGLFTWDTTDGNVILQTAETREGFAVNLFLTAGTVREFPPLR
jgi:hypothetical protein